MVARPFKLAMAALLSGLHPGTAAAAEGRALDPIQACASHYGSDFVPVVGPHGAVPVPLEQPAHAVATIEPNFGTCMLRVTDQREQRLEGHARNFYSRFQAFNADDTLLLVDAGDGHFHLFDANTLGHVRSLPEIGGHDGEPQWHPDDPRRLRFMPPDNRASITELDLDTGRTTELVDFSTGRHPWGELAQVRTRWEGSPSLDARFWCLMAYDPREDFLGVFSYDLENNDVLGLRRMDDPPDHVSTSPSGRWCVVSHEREQGGTVAWRRDFSRARTLHAASEHSDLAIGPNGEDLYVFVDYDTDGALVALDIDSGKRVSLLDTYANESATAYHVSARSTSRPGWVLFSTYAGKPPRQWFHEKLIAIELKANPRMVTLADHRSHFDGYSTAPVATVNRDFTRVLFGSNWGRGGAEAMEVYLIVLPSGMLGDPGR